MNKKGFTLIELILYMAIVSVFLASLIPAAWDIVGGSVKSGAEQEVSSQARLVSERFKYEIRNAVDINTGASNFGIDLATDQTKQLSFKETVASGNDPTIFNVVNGKLMVKLGGASAVELNSNDTKITSLTFTNYTSVDNKTKNIQYTFTIDDNFGSARQEYDVPVITIRGTAEVRSN